VLDSVRVRLTLCQVAVLAFLLILFSMAVYALMSSILYGRVDAVLSSVVDGTISMLTKEANEEGLLFFAPSHALKALSFPDTSLAIFDAQGKLLAQKNIRGYRADTPPVDGLALAEIRKYSVPEPDRAGGFSRAAALKVRVLPVDQTFIIVANQSLDPVLRQLDTLRRILGIVLPVAILLAGFAGWFLARKSLAPVVAMSEQARRIGAENLEERLSITNPRDELGRLASTFNELLSRLNAAFSQQRQFMADASHELRTPVSVIQTAAAVLLDREHREEEEYRNVLGIIDGQVRRLGRIIEDLFRLSRADSGHYVLERNPFYLDELLAETGRAASMLAASKEISVQVPEVPELLYEGDEELMRRMIWNLLDNAIKYTAPGGSVQVRFEARQRSYAITVSDSGPGIPPEAQPYIFERFFRADEAHSRANNPGSGGAGLGLPIARWIAEAHQGRLELQQSDERGTKFVIILPAAPLNPSSVPPPERPGGGDRPFASATDSR
jgi:heavy metal sensor kinase